MKFLRNIIIVLVVLVIAVEFLPFNILLYKENMRLSSNQTSSHKTSPTHVTYKSTNTTTNEVLVKNNGIDVNSYTIPTIIFYGLDEKDDEVYAERNSDQIRVFIERKDINIGNAIYVPLVKLVGFSANVDYKWNLNVQENNGTLSIEGSGSVNVNGSKNIYGIYPVKKAVKSIEQIIKNEIMKNAQSSIEQTVTNAMENRVLDGDIRI